ncbi:MAG: hypothetical protein WC516_09590 [Patescibacteria group bacterium]|jgi:hypothetical protein
MTIKQAEQITKMYEKEEGKIAIINTMVKAHELTEAEAGFLIYDLNNKGEINVL